MSISGSPCTTALHHCMRSTCRGINSNTGSGLGNSSRTDFSAAFAMNFLLSTMWTAAHDCLEAQHTHADNLASGSASQCLHVQGKAGTSRSPSAA